MSKFDEADLGEFLATNNQLKEVSIYLRPKKVFRILLVVILFLTGANFIALMIERILPDFPLRDAFIRCFSADLELNFPSIYSSFTLLLCSILLGIITYFKKTQLHRYANYWGCLSLIFAYLALDELISIHEYMMIFKVEFTISGFLHFAWVIPGTILTILFFLAFSRFTAHLPSKTRNLFIFAGGIFVCGAIGCEMIGGYFVDLYTRKSILYAFEVIIEEFLEMLGIAVFIYALISYQNTHLKILGLQVKFIDK